MNPVIFPISGRWTIFLSAIGPDSLRQPWYLFSHQCSLAHYFSQNPLAITVIFVLLQRFLTVFHNYNLWLFTTHCFSVPKEFRGTLRGDGFLKDEHCGDFVCRLLSGSRSRRPLIRSDFYRSQSPSDAKL